jgi:lysophospholipase L1-like esterase
MLFLHQPPVDKGEEGMNRGFLIAGLGLALLAGVFFKPADAGKLSMHMHAPVYYLSLGTSLAAGVQADENGASVVTDVSYPGLLAEIIAEDIPKLRHVNLGCPGEDSDTFIDGGICDYRSGSQLDQAVHFLRAHRKAVGLITIDLGANDALSCLQGTRIDLQCIAETIPRLAENLAEALGTLREAAGPEVPIVGMNYYDPLLALWFDDPATAALSATLQDQINGALENVYAQFDIPVADVAGAFGDGDLVTDENNNGVPDSVETICAWTWMCPLQNIHPNEKGYQVIADAFAAVLPPLVPEHVHYHHHGCSSPHRK